jgi:cell division FtsZ-interacting protein ZapD
MIPSKEELIERVREQRSPEMEALRNRIVKKLEAEYREGTRVYVDVENVDQFMIDTVASELSGKGWKVDFTGNQRDGNSLVIS